MTSTGPTLAMVGEGGEAEAIVPLSKLTTLLKSGVGNVSATTGVTVNLTVNVSGGANAADDVRRGVNEAIPSLKRELEPELPANLPLNGYGARRKVISSR